MSEGATTNRVEGAGPLADAFDAGRRAGLAVAALALSVVAFLSLLGAEKAILALVLAAAALRGARAGAPARRLAVAAVVLATLFLITVAVVLVVFWDQLAELVALLEKLS